MLLGLVVRGDQRARMLGTKHFAALLDHDLGKRSRLEPPEPPNRYERKRPGELIHIDVKKLGRFGVAGKRMVGRRHASAG